MSREQVKREILALMVCNEEPICHLVNSGEPCNIDCLHDKFANQILSHPRIAVLAEEQTEDNPYPKSVFPTELEEVREFINDDKKFSGISGAYGRHFFEVVFSLLRMQGWRKTL